MQILGWLLFILGFLLMFLGFSYDDWRNGRK